jgi:hypothetical protein
MIPVSPFLWPALAAATASEMVSALAKELGHLAAGTPSSSIFREPKWTTPIPRETRGVTLSALKIGEIAGILEKWRVDPPHFLSFRHTPRPPMALAPSCSLPRAAPKLMQDT